MKEIQTYKNGKIVGMMKAASFLQKQYEEYASGKVWNPMDVRESFAAECRKEGFDMFAYLRKGSFATTSTEKGI